MKHVYERTFVNQFISLLHMYIYTLLLRCLHQTLSLQRPLNAVAEGRFAGGCTRISMQNPGQPRIPIASQSMRQSPLHTSTRGRAAVRLSNKGQAREGLPMRRSKMPFWLNPKSSSDWHVHAPMRRSKMPFLVMLIHESQRQ